MTIISGCILAHMYKMILFKYDDQTCSGDETLRIMKITRMLTRSHYGVPIKWSGFENLAFLGWESQHWFLLNESLSGLSEIWFVYMFIFKRMFSS